MPSGNISALLGAQMEAQPAMVGAAARAMADRATEANPQELSNTAWALARLRT